MSVVPIDQLERRLPTAGRIRIGVKRKQQGGRERPDKIDTFRFTSEDRASVEQVAGLYGGDVHPWQAMPGQFEVITHAKVIKVVLPPDPLGGTPFYELWSGGGCQRRCTGRKCMVLGSGPEGGEMQEVDCICAHTGKIECKRTTRLSVLLPEVRFLGTWRLDTKSKIASVELPGMVETIVMMQQHRGLQQAELHLVKRRGPKGWMFIPQLGFDKTLDQLAALHTPPRGELVAGPPSAEHMIGPGDMYVDESVPRMVPFDTFPAGSLRPVVDVEEAALAQPAYHADPNITRAWREALTGAQKAKVLNLVRQEWGSVSMPPSTFEDISDEVIDVLIERGV